MMSIRHGKTKRLWMGSKDITSNKVIFKKNGCIPAVKEKELEIILKQHPELKDVFIDVTERPIVRKSDYEWQKKDFSWKKKKHSAKNVLITTNSWEILAVSKTEVGSKHDYTMLKESWYIAVLLGLTIRVDLWFQWIVKDYPYHDVMIPTKKPKWKELTSKQPNPPKGGGFRSL